MSTTAQPAMPLEQDFTQLSQHLQTVEYLTIPGFMRRIPHRWHLDEINRFGDKCGKSADAMQLSYMTTVDAALGPLRVFPLPFLTRIYKLLSVQFGWPRIIDEVTPALEDQRKQDAASLRGHERVAKMLRDLLPGLPSTDHQHSCAMLLAWLNEECERLRRQLGEADEGKQEA